MSDDNLANLTVEILKDIRQGVQGLRTDTNERFERMDERFERMDARFERMDERFERMEERSERMEQVTIAGFAGVHERLERVDARLVGIRDLAGERLRDHEARIRALEARNSTG